MVGLEIQFTNSSYLLMEDDDLLFIQLIMNGTSSLPISVTVRPVYGSAKGDHISIYCGDNK